MSACSHTARLHTHSRQTSVPRVVDDLALVQLIVDRSTTLSSFPIRSPLNLCGRTAFPGDDLSATVPPRRRKLCKGFARQSPCCPTWRTIPRSQVRSLMCVECSLCQPLDNTNLGDSAWERDLQVTESHGCAVTDSVSHRAKHGYRETSHILVETSPSAAYRDAFHIHAIFSQSATCQMLITHQPWQGRPWIASSTVAPAQVMESPLESDVSPESAWLMRHACESVRSGECCSNSGTHRCKAPRQILGTHHHGQAHRVAPFMRECAIGECCSSSMG
jgi:hypothetical protein